ncbi:phosphotransferase [Kitasatospora sp. NPDC001547]|uniref:phosphotransferase n=1 Tax=Kitasatospora sp. NPDC001547 TaxID=3364015 RepID=UPI00369053F0
MCEHPSLLMTHHLPGSVRPDQDDDTAARADLLAAQLPAVHALHVDDSHRPRTWQAWTAPERVAVPRDFHPGNVLFTGTGITLTGVVDWVETSWGPADLDVAQYATTVALLHGPQAGHAFTDRYTAAGGRTLSEGRDHLYWRLLDTLAFAPDAEKVAAPWRELGRTDLTPPRTDPTPRGLPAGPLRPLRLTRPGLGQHPVAVGRASRHHAGLHAERSSLGSDCGPPPGCVGATCGSGVEIGCPAPGCSGRMRPWTTRWD